MGFARALGRPIRILVHVLCVIDQSKAPVGVLRIQR
jgi:hypothetical protein